MRNKKAISLIVLVITIIVMIILASAIIMSLDNVNIFNKAESAVLMSDAKNFVQEANIAFAEEQLEDRTFITSEVNAVTVEDIQKYIPDFEEKYYGKLIIQNGEVVYVAGNVTEEEKQSFEAAGIKAGDYITKEKADEIKDLEDKANIPADTTTTDVRDVIEGIPEDYADMFTIFQGHLYYRWEKTTSDERISLYNAGIPALLGDCNGDGTLTTEDSDLIASYDGFQTQDFEGNNNSNTYYIGDLYKDNIIDGTDESIIYQIVNNEEDAYTWIATKAEQNPTKLEFLGDYRKVEYQALYIAEAKDTNSYVQIMNLAPGLTSAKAKRFAIIQEMAVYRYETLSAEEITWLNEAELYYNLGDVNLDGKLTVEDTKMISEMGASSDLSNYTDIQKKLADLSGDTFVDVIDAALLSRIVKGTAKLEDCFK